MVVFLTFVSFINILVFNAYLLFININSYIYTIILSILLNIILLEFHENTEMNERQGELLSPNFTEKTIIF